MTRVRKLCECCRAEFSVPASHSWREYACSSPCKRFVREQRARESARYRSRECDECDSHFIPRWAQIRQGQGRYCSNACGIKAAIRAAKSPEAIRRCTQARAESLAQGKWQPPRGVDHPNYQGGRWLADGYVWVRVNGTPMAEHRLVMERKLGRKLLSSEIVHHKDHNKTNNDPENLEIMTRADHIREHHDDILAARWAP